MATNKLHDLNNGSQALFIAELIVLSGIFLLGIELLNLMGIHQGHQIVRDNSAQLLHLVIFVLPIQLSAFAVGLYSPKRRETYRDILRRLVVAVALGYFTATIVYTLFPIDEVSLNFREWITLASLLVLIFLRYFVYSLRYKKLGRKRVLVLGAGERASIIENRMRRKVDRIGFNLVGFVRMPGDKGKDEGGIRNETIVELDVALEDYVLENRIEEIVVACDERRDNLPVESLFTCKINGVDIVEILDFIEKETGQIAVNLIFPSWVIYSNGFQSTNYLRNSLDWVFNAGLAFFVLLLTWPIMLITILAIKLEEGFKAPIFYTQQRIGLGGRPFNIVKFRSMRTDAEKDGPQWAQKQDARVTRVGNLIRKYRVDELPQLYNVFHGDMGFVGPRPERPEFVTDLAKKIPYFNERHNVKPGLTGWAQLKYPYGASDEDSMEKLKFDLYYIKHRSFLLDLMILVRTVEIVLFGQGR